MNGWIKLHRELMKKVIWVNGTPEQRVILVTLLCMANYEPNKWEFGGRVYEVQAGQFITSVEGIVQECNCKEITTRKVRTALERFKKLGFLTTQTSNKNTLITIVNWGKYQDSADRRQTSNTDNADRQPTSDPNCTDRQSIINTDNADRQPTSNQDNADRRTTSYPGCTERQSTSDPDSADRQLIINQNNSGKQPTSESQTNGSQNTENMTYFTAGETANKNVTETIAYTDDWRIIKKPVDNQNDSRFDNQPSNTVRQAGRAGDGNLTTNKEYKNKKLKNKEYTAVSRTAAAGSSAVEHYIRNISPVISPFETEKLMHWVRELKGDEVVICAIDDAVMFNHRNLQYIEKILDRCRKQGIYTAEAFRAQKERYNLQKESRNGGFGIKQNSFNNYEQRDYEEEYLEKIVANKRRKDCSF